MLNDLEDKLFLPKRLFRLRGFVYFKIPWMETHDILSQLVDEGHARQIKGNWIAHRDVCDRNTEVKDEHKKDLTQKRRVYDEWNGKSAKLGYHAEVIVQKAVKDEGYL